MSALLHDLVGDIESSVSGESWRLVSFGVSAPENDIVHVDYQTLPSGKSENIKIFQWSSLEVKRNKVLYLHFLSGDQNCSDFHVINHICSEEQTLKSMLDFDPNHNIFSYLVLRTGPSPIFESRKFINHLIILFPCLCNSSIFSDPTKFFGCELGAQTQFDIKNDRFIVNGAHEAGKLQQMLDIFIKKFVLCPGCDNPETVLTVHAKKQTISQSCKACGYNGQLDMRHKLTTFILKNPPELSPAAQGASLTEGKKAKRGKKSDGQSGEKGSDGSENELDATNEVDEDDWAVDVSAAAVKARMEDLTNGAKGLTISDDMEKTPKERIDLFYSFVKQRRDQGMLSKPGADKDIVSEAERLDVKDKAPLILCELIFDSNILSQMKTYRSLLSRSTQGNPKAQKALLGGVECIIQLNQTTLLPKVPHILKGLYDLDLVDEEVMIDWGSKPSRKYVSKELNAEILAKAQAFITWLKEAEEESEDDSDDSDVEIEYDDRARPTTLIEQKNATPQLAKTAVKVKSDDNEDDLDIDAI
uniref:Eukaryotic translation initiation factor 5 n=1 Tax=Daphnia magna TaxID=35525 RepID=A0A4Y7MJB1_9CRUS|nr:EOG090X05QT [Daphnia magna]